VQSDEIASHGQPQSLVLNLPPLGVLVMKPV
jgi:1,4-alpha-glucan branching enzyme